MIVDDIFWRSLPPVHIGCGSPKLAPSAGIKEKNFIRYDASWFSCRIFISFAAGGSARFPIGRIQFSCRILMWCDGCASTIQTEHIINASRIRSFVELDCNWTQATATYRSSWATNINRNSRSWQLLHRITKSARPILHSNSIGFCTTQKTHKPHKRKWILHKITNTILHSW